MYFYHAILSFCLPIYLKINCVEKLSLDFMKVTEQKPQLRYKNRSTIIDDKV